MDEVRHGQPPVVPWGSMLHPFNRRQLGAHLAALRRLPPHARLRRSGRPDERSLQERLLGLPDEVDAVDWLVDHEGAAAARLALRRVLDALRREAESNRRGGSGRPVPDWAQAIWDDRIRAWRDLDRVDDAFAGLASADDDAAVRAVFARVRAHRRPREASPGVPADRGDFSRLIEDLVGLEPGADPLAWMRRERAGIAAVLALEELLRAASPVGPEALGQPLFRASPGDVALFPGRAELRLAAFALFRDGFSAEVGIRVLPEGVPRPPGPGAVSLLWLGFDEVHDDLGYRYVLRGCDFRSTDPRGQGLLSIYSAEYYPGPPERARRLVFACSPVRLIPLALGRDGETLPIPEMELAPLRWAVDLPAERA